MRDEKAAPSMQVCVCAPSKFMYCSDKPGMSFRSRWSQLMMTAQLILWLKAIRKR